MTNIGAHPGGAGLGLGQRQSEGQQISAEANHAGPRAGVLNYPGVLGHYSGSFLNKIIKYNKQYQFAKIL
jgi:hypothetical protein